MSKPQDGFVSRVLNRPISRRITHFLLKFPIYPNAWTIAIFVLPLIACVFLIHGGYVSIIVGAAIFQVFSILDGCDAKLHARKTWNQSSANAWITSAILLQAFCMFSLSG